MKCSYCNRIIQDNAKRCPSCLKEIDSSIKQEPQHIEPTVQETREMSRINSADLWHYDEKIRNKVITLYCLSLLGLLIPFFNIILPFLYQRLNKEHYDVNINMKKLLNFQIYISIFYYSSLFILLADLIIIGPSFYSLIVFLISLMLLGINLFFTTMAIFKILSGHDFSFPISLYLKR